MRAYSDQRRERDLLSVVRSTTGQQVRLVAIRVGRERRLRHEVLERGREVSAVEFDALAFPDLRAALKDADGAKERRR